MAKEGPRSVCVCLLLCFCVYYCRTLIKLVCGEGDSEVNYYVSVVLRRICLCVCLLLQYLLQSFSCVCLFVTAAYYCSTFGVATLLGSLSQIVTGFIELPKNQVFGLKTVARMSLHHLSLVQNSSLVQNPAPPCCSSFF